MPEWPMLSHFVLLRTVLVLDMLPIAPRYRLVLPAEVEDRPPSVPVPFPAVEGVRLLLVPVPALVQLRAHLPVALCSVHWQ